MAWINCTFKGDAQSGSQDIGIASCEDQATGFKYSQRVQGVNDKTAFKANAAASLAAYIAQEARNTQLSTALQNFMNQ